LRKKSATVIVPCSTLTKKLTLKFRRRFPGVFVFANEYRPNRLILAILEITLTLLGIVANLPFLHIRK
jgi:hypothetical protein